MNNQAKAVFLDRDGVLNKELGDYVCRLADFNVLEHNLKSLLEIQNRGYLLIVITNQGGLAKGWYSDETLSQMHAHLRAIYADHGINLVEIYYCNHHPEFNGRCLCRKPNSILIEKALARFNIAAAQSYFIGDRERDIMAGEAAGVKGILINSNQSIAEVLDQIA